MSFKKTDKIIDELASQLFSVEGKVTDLLTSETMQNLNANMQSTTEAVAIGSALAGQIGNAALANFAASDEGIDVTVFAVEVMDDNNVKHYFKGCFPEARKNVDQIRKNLGQQLQAFKKEVDGWLIKSRKTSADANKNSKTQTTKPNSSANEGQKSNNTNQGKTNSSNNSSIGQTAITNLSNKFKGILGEHMADYYC